MREYDNNLEALAISGRPVLLDILVAVATLGAMSQGLHLGRDPAVLAIDDDDVVLINYLKNI